MHERAVTAVAAMMALASLLPASLGAQISPGPLARAHASLDVPLGCAKCHGTRKESITQKCLSCHREVAALQEQTRGYHARGEAATKPCASCHPDHAGRDFELIEWPGKSRDRFNHAWAGWALEGKHAEVTCASCHTQAFRADPVAALSPRSGGPNWAGLQQRCASCHDDPHRPSLGAQCTKCHDLNGWKPAPAFDHERTSYPLTGEHVNVKCASCHLAPRLHPRRDTAGHLLPVFRPVPAGECSSCHTDPHRSAAMARCSSCHVTTSFRALRKGSFTHERTRFPLLGEHAVVPCAQCHAGYPRRVDRPAFAACASCHGDPHRGQATLAGRAVDCAACHTERGFTPATFTVAQHRNTAYPLVGRHATARCGDCHRARDLAPPPAPAPVTRALAPPTVRRIAELRPPFAACTDCHVDPHRPGPGTPADARGSGAFSGGCERCHDAHAFRPSLLDVAAHARFRMPLEGAHRTVPCAGCHAELRAQAPRPQGWTLLHQAAGRGITPITLRASTTCASCHATPHGTQFDARRDRGACESCHSVAAFRPADRFDHERETRFPLAPAHTRVPCASCHVPPADTRRPVTYRGTTVRCATCHTGGPR